MKKRQFNEKLWAVVGLSPFGGKPIVVWPTIRPKRADAIAAFESKDRWIRLYRGKTYRCVRITMSGEA